MEVGERDKEIDREREREWGSGREKKANDEVKNRETDREREIRERVRERGSEREREESE